MQEKPGLQIIFTYRRSRYSLHVSDVPIKTKEQIKQLSND